MTDSTKVLPAMVFSEFIKIRIDDQYKENVEHAVSKAVAGRPNSHTCKASFKVNRHVGRIIKTFHFYIQKVN